MKGTLRREEAQDGAIEALRPLRYGANDYFYVQNYQGMTVLNDPNRKLEGQVRLDAKDPDGGPNVKLQIEAAKAGGGFVYYRVPPPDSKEPVPKGSYAGGFRPLEAGNRPGVFGRATAADDIHTR